MSDIIELSDDDDSFILPKKAEKLEQLSGEDSVLLSDDNDAEERSSNTVDYFTSDEEYLPEIDLKSRKKKVLKQLFPTPEKLRWDDAAGPSKVSPVKLRDPGFDKMIGGVTVNLPVDPYGCQIALMSKVITAIKTGKNCLLESPTGSGKTLALLCGALAWQRHERMQRGQRLAQQNAERITELKSFDGAVDYVASIPNVNFSKSVFGEKSIYDKPVNCGDNSCSKRQEPLQDSFEGTPEKGLVRIQKRRRVNSTESSSGSSTKGSPYKLPSTPQKPGFMADPQTPESAKFLIRLLHNWVTDDVNCSVPTIYYGARTHKQLQQVIKEFKRTSYRGEAKMTVLSSRDYSCIRDFDKNLWTSKNDMCRGCIKPHASADRPKGESNCKFYDNRTALHHGSLPPAFDLEELVEAGKENSSCPYFAARAMAASAHIVFCPYNYLIEPSIRSSMQINLKENIVVIDEAHNIEDICRDAASFSFTREQLQAAITELEKAASYQYSGHNIMDQLEKIVKTLKTWDDWFVNQSTLVNNRPVNNNEAVYAWHVADFVTTLNNHNLGQPYYSEFKHNVEVFTQRLREDARTLVGVTQATGTLLESLDAALTYLFRSDGQFMDDFKPALVRTVAADAMSEATSWRNSQFNQKIKKDVYELRLLCMNPAVVFEGLKTARCIILASGTLTPLVSLYSELGTDFPLKVSPNHVISSDRVWVGTLSTCPDGSRLECKSTSAAQPGVQDAIGDTILWVSQVTPHGVLVFLPSYQLMNRLARRWQETGIWRKLEQQKNVFMESRNVRDHNDTMEDFYKYVETDRGAILFAVFRGKVSEGMDFKDHQARAVITSSSGEIRTRVPRITGRIIVFIRALNQAVGRCVRHRGDWGAVLMIDARFQNPYYTEHLSKWLRGFLNNNHHTFESLVNSPNSLESFMQSMTINETEDV
ncbi:Fanconi anemia group J protein homolog [Ostrinia furnacalis]|uniref:Fanconi anemia group J protein homolog n=2 Tax=Ostrinia furnacalis TaxID=93504 RepID=UPI00103ABEEE|nr:Fanconi anemia group J protein homolog [Ostrinia furnacalis]